MSRVVPGAALSSKPKGRKAATDTATFAKKEEPIAPVSQSSGRPDKSAHDASIAVIDAEIAKLKAAQDQLKQRISASDPKSASFNEERTKLRAELNALKESQAAGKSSRGQTLDEMKRLQNKVAEKVKELNSAKSKFPYKNGQEIDHQIKNLERQVESGTMKLVEERKALNEIGSLKKMRKTVEGFSAQQDAIEADKKAVEEIKARLDDPEAKAANDQYNALKEKLDALNAKSDEAYKGRNKLYEERDALKKQMDEQYGKRRELQAAYKAANDAYYAKVQEERSRRIERQRAERQAIEEAKRTEINERLLEEASAPAFEREIEDCKTLIEYFNRGGGKASSTVPTPTLALSTDSPSKLPSLDIRRIDAALPDGATALPKKNAATEDDWFAGLGGKKGKKGKKTGATKVEGEQDAPSPVSSQALQLPLATLSALLKLEVPAPMAQSDVPATIEALQTKQKWFQENQEQTTKKRIEAVKAKIARATEAVSNPPAQTNGRTKKARRASAEADQISPAEGEPAAVSAEVDESAPDAEEPTVSSGDAEPVTSEELKAAEEEA